MDISTSRLIYCTYLPVYLITKSSIYLPIYLPVKIFVHLSILSIDQLIWLSINLLICLQYLPYLFIYVQHLPTYLSAYLSTIYLLSVYPSIHLSTIQKYYEHAKTFCVRIPTFPSYFPPKSVGKMAANQFSFASLNA